uniref:ATP-dependent DNA helicase n=1 Tax=Tanacetum cinerariifolium TaxID=118510 RepID=A0A699HZC6_TANCI|nr:ATP-dependent DNA helicase PIF7-like [Tanacetum cinerariifolium]
MPNQHLGTLRNSECLPDLLEREGINVTMFTDWFDLNERHPPARILMCAEILKHYVCHEQSKMWKQRKQGRCIGGTEKTFLYKPIISRLRSECKIVIAVAYSDIAFLFLLARRTTHSRFIIPLELLENSTCGIKQNTHLTKLMQEVELIIWDEAPTIQKYAFEALDKTLRDTLGYLALETKNKIFGGLTVLLGSDFR